MDSPLQPSTGACYLNGWFASGNRIVTYVSPFASAPIIVDFPALRGSHVVLRPNGSGFINIDTTVVPVGALAALGLQPYQGGIVAVNYP